MTLIFHVGAPKTGTSAIQRFCYLKREFLLEKKINYFSQVDNPLNDPRHNRFVMYCMKQDIEKMYEYMAEVNNESQFCNYAVISTEGLFYNLPRFTGKVISHLIFLSKKYEWECAVVFREKTDFLKSLYKQCLRNPRSSIAPEFGMDISFADFCKISYIENLSNRDFMENHLSSIFLGRLIELNYSKSIVHDFMEKVFFIDEPLFDSEFKNNPSLSNDAAELVRRINGLSISPQLKVCITKLACDIDIKNHASSSMCESLQDISDIKQKLIYPVNENKNWEYSNCRVKEIIECIFYR